MDAQSNVFLVGPMGSGKSAVGRRLARNLKRRFVDSDDVIEARTGVDIPFIFDKEGESGFRRREREIIAELTGEQDQVLATGGGSVQDPDNRRLLAQRGTVVYLHTTVPEQLKRTRHGRERPLLTGGDPARTLADLMSRREPLYREIAHIIIDTDGRTVASVAREIEERLGELADG